METKFRNTCSNSNHAFKEYIMSKYLETALHEHARRTSANDIKIPNCENLLLKIEQTNKEAASLYLTQERKKLNSTIDQQYLKYLLQEKKGYILSNTRELLVKKYSPTLPNLLSTPELREGIKTRAVSLYSKNESIRESFAQDQFEKDKMVFKRLLNDSVSPDSKEYLLRMQQELKEIKSSKPASIIEHLVPDSKPVNSSIDKTINERFKFKERIFKKRQESYNKNLNFKEYYAEMKQFAVSPKSLTNKEMNMKSFFAEMSKKSIKIT